MVCWWENNASDNNIANKYGIGPNDVTDLTIAIFNYLGFGIYNPERNDLKNYVMILKKSSRVEYSN